MSPCLETTYKQDQRSGLILVSLWALHPLTVLALMKHDHRMKESKNPAGTCWEGRERESGRQEVPTEIANTTTCLFCFLGSMVNPKVINIWLGWPDKMCPHQILHSPSSLASISAALKAAPSAVLQASIPWASERIQALLEWNTYVGIAAPLQRAGWPAGLLYTRHLDNWFQISVCSTTQGLLLEDIFEPHETLRYL